MEEPCAKRCLMPRPPRTCPLWDSRAHAAFVRVTAEPTAAAWPERSAVINRSQALVIGFFVTAAGSLIVMRVAAPDTYKQVLGLPPNRHGCVGTGFLITLTAALTVLSIAVLRRWRWTFWPILIAFLSGVLRVPVAILQLTDAWPAHAPNWYLAYQGILGLVQFAIGLAMVADYRRSGTWGNRPH